MVVCTRASTGVALCHKKLREPSFEWSCQIKYQ